MGRDRGISIKKAFEIIGKKVPLKMPTKGDSIDLEQAIGFNTQEHYALRNCVQFAIFHPDKRMRRVNAQMLEIFGVKDAFCRDDEIYITLKSEDIKGILAYLCKVYPEYENSSCYSFEH
jgi:hypothetical protein